MQPATHQGIRFRLIIAGMFVCLMMIVCTGFGLTPAVQQKVSNINLRSVLHWRNARYDWLLVVDHQTHEVQVYNAADGRPLGRLGALQKLLADSMRP